MTVYVSKPTEPTEIEAMQWCRQGCSEQCVHSWPDHDDAEAIVAWVNANGGEARYERALGGDGRTGMEGRNARIAVRTINGWAYAAPGHYVVMGSETFRLPDPHGPGLGSRRRELRNFYPRDPATFEKQWEPKR